MAAELLRMHGGALSTAVVQAGLIAAAMVPVGMATNALLLAAFSLPPRESAAFVSAAAARNAPRLAAVWLIFTAIGAASLALGYFLAEGLHEAAAKTFGTRAGDLTYAAILAIGVVGALIASIILDLARAALVAGGLDIPGAMLATARTLRRSPIVPFLAWWARAATSAAVVVSGMLIMVRQPQPSAVALPASAALHLAIAASVVLLRMSWIARSMQLVGPEAHEEEKRLAVANGDGLRRLALSPHGTAGHTDEQDDPSSTPDA